VSEDVLASLKRLGRVSASMLQQQYEYTARLEAITRKDLVERFTETVEVL
jgi:hypothetical protein